MLFHFHYWTPFVEETERFYMNQGFRVTQRIGKHEGAFQEFNPPLGWDDFRERKILFRIVEMKRGAVNITFGFGKRVMFDHIGFLVSDDEKREICERARRLGWSVDDGERRTFLAAPYGFRIELQTHEDAVDSVDDGIRVTRMQIAVKQDGLEADLSHLLPHWRGGITSVVRETCALEEVTIDGLVESDVTDPNAVRIRTKESIRET